MNNFYTPVQRGKGKQRDTGSVSPVEPMHKRENAPVQPVEKQKTLTSEKPTHRLIRRTISQASV